MRTSCRVSAGVLSCIAIWIAIRCPQFFPMGGQTPLHAASFCNTWWLQSTVFHHRKKGTQSLIIPVVYAAGSLPSPSEPSVARVNVD